MNEPKGSESIHDANDMPNIPVQKQSTSFTLHNTNLGQVDILLAGQKPLTLSLSEFEGVRTHIYTTSSC